MIMIMMADTYLRRGRRRMQCFLKKPGVLTTVWAAAYFLAGFLLSGAGIRQTFQPIAAGMITVLGGWQALAMTLGSMLGYRVFWGMAGIQGTVWAAAGGMLALLLQRKKKWKEDCLLISMLVGAMTAALGLYYRVLYEEGTDMLTYFLRIFTAAGAAALGNRLVYCRDTVMEWLAGGVLTLSLSQVAPIPYLSLGYLAGGCIAAMGTFPAAALAGLGLDFSQITRVPMTAVLAISYFLRLIPFSDRWVRYLSPAGAYLLTTLICGVWDPAPLPGLILGGGIAMLLPIKRHGVFRRGPTGAAQVRLELSAGVMTGMQRIFLEHGEGEIDREALLEKARNRACSRCPYQKDCHTRRHLKTGMLQNPLGVTCRKTGRLVTELQRSQEQMKVMVQQQKRRQEFRTAMIQQYGFLSQYLQNLADQLPRKGEASRPSYCVQVSARSHRKEKANGDCCFAFPGVGCRYYVLLCDGMGTGIGAEEEGKTAGKLMKQMLKSGFPPEYVLQNINSILILRGQAGAVTVDLAELRLDTGRATLYKWGAAASWFIRNGRAEKIGTATPPPGISMEETREAVRQLSLRRGEMLVLLSDGMDGERALSGLSWSLDITTGALAEQLLKKGCDKTDDDATAAVIRLRPTPLADR